MNYRIIILCLILATTSQVTSYRLLLAVPVASKSLHYLFTSIASNLVQAGHHVTLLSSYHSSATHPNLTHVNVLGSKPLPEDNIFDVKELFEAMALFTKNSLYIGEVMWSNEKVLQIWEKRQTFDAVLIPSYINEIAMPFLIDFTGSFVIVSTPGVEYFAIGASGNWLSPSVVPAIILPYDEQMTFMERCINFITLITLSAYTPRIYFWKQNNLLIKFFPSFEGILRFVIQ